MLLRDVEPGDLDVYIRMRCDPVMMTELGGPQPRETMPAKVAADVASVHQGTAWISMIVPDETHPDEIAGSVVMWEHDFMGDTISEMGWSVLPEFQNRGIATEAAQLLLQRDRTERRWGSIHAFPGVNNKPSNALCERLGFRLIDDLHLPYHGAILHVNHWILEEH